VRAALRTLHAWAGATCGLVLAVIGLSGALLVFEDDYLRATLPGAGAVPAADVATLGAVLERLESAGGAMPRNVVFGTSTLGLHTVDYGHGDGAYVDGQGTPVATWRAGMRLENLLFELHHSLFAGDVGERIAGWLALVAVALVASGVVLWLPARRAFRPRPWPASGKRRDVVAHHRDLGLLVALPLAVQLVTGAGLAFPTQAQGLLAAITGDPAVQPRPSPPAAPGDVDWRSALAAAQARFPDARLRIAIWPARPGDPATLRLRRDGEWHANGRTVVQVDPATGAVLGAVDAHALPRAVRAYHALWPLHAAKLGGRAIDLLVFTCGIALALLGSLASWTFLRARLPRQAWRMAAQGGSR
jgi:uncharacterized iron-regulated membrane protein